jgi:hypothetical protein
LYQKTTKQIGLVILSLILSVAMAGCGSYVGPENIYDLTDDDHQLLYYADPWVNYKMDIDVIAVIEADDMEVELILEGTAKSYVADDTFFPGLQFDFEGTIASSNGASAPVKIQVRTLDGIFYSNTVGPGFGESDNWLMFSLPDSLAGMVEEDVDELMGELGSETGNIEHMGDLLDLLQIYNFTEVDMRGEEEIKGVKTKRFQTELDILDFILSPEMLDVMQDPEMDAIIGEQEILDLLPMLNMILPMLIPEFSLEVNQYVAIDTGYLQRSEYELDLEMSFSVLGGLALDSNRTVNELAVKVWMETDYHDFGESIEIDIPTEVTEIDFGESLGIGF